MASDREDNSELSWLAFRYVVGELTPAETAEFEARLESDQSAREMVAEAVELAAAVEIASRSKPEATIQPASLLRAANGKAPPLPGSPAQVVRLRASYHAGAPRWMVPAGGLAVAAAGLAAVLIVHSLSERPGSGENPHGSRAHGSAIDDRRLADAWAASAWRDTALPDRDAPAEDERPPEFDLLPEEFAAEVLDADGNLVAGAGSALSTWDSADDELLISDWLWEAVSGAQEAPASASDRLGNQGEG